MIEASIDIGTNTVLLLVAEKRGGRLEVHHEEQRLPRLGKQADSDKNLNRESMDRVIRSLREFAAFLKERFPQLSGPPVVTATSAVRDAPNRALFLNAVEEATGWAVRVLSGEEESQITYRGALSVLDPQIVKGRRTLILDIGGGSTEFALGEEGKLLAAQSLDMGSVRFTENYFNSLPPAEEEKSVAARAVRNLLRDLRGELVSKEVERSPGGGQEKQLQLVGVAGTVTSIAALSAGLTHYETEKLNGMDLPLSEIRKYRKLFEGLPPMVIEERYAPFLVGRGEVITAGLIILEEVLGFYNKHLLTVSTGGVRHGMLI